MVQWNNHDPGEDDDEDSFIAQCINDDDETTAIFDRALHVPGNDNEDDPEAAAVELDLAALDAKASDLICNPISKSCLRASNSQHALFVLYCWMHDKQALKEDACTNLEALQVQFGSMTEKKKQKLLPATLLILNGNLCPLHLYLVTGQRFLRYLLLLLNSAGKHLLASVYSNKCAALFHLFRSLVSGKLKHCRLT